jgi:hypothetical protein
MSAAKTKPTEYCVADAVGNAVSDLSTLRDELQEWFDNLPENFQNGDKGSQLEEAIGELDEADSFDGSALIDATNDAGDPAEPSSLHFTFPASTKRRMSRADRCSEATSLLRAAMDEVRQWLDASETDEDGNTVRDPGGDIAQALGDLEDLIDRAEGVTFPGMYG